MSRFQDDKFQPQKDNTKTRSENITNSRFNDSKNNNSVDNSKLNSTGNSSKIDKSVNNSRLNNTGDSSKVSQSVKRQPRQDGLSTSRLIDGASNSKFKSSAITSQLQLSPKTSNQKVTETTTKLQFKSDKNRDFRSDKDSKVIKGKPNRRLHFHVVEEKGENGTALKFNSTKKTRFTFQKEHTVRLNYSTSVSIAEKDINALEQKLKKTKKEYRLARKELKYEQKHENNNQNTNANSSKESATQSFSSSRLYEHDNSSKLQLSLTPKTSESRFINSSEKSSLAIKLYNKHNPKKEANDMQQLRKYNLNFNLRNKLFAYNRASFSFGVTRKNFLEYSTRENFSLDKPLDKKINFEQVDKKLKIEKKLVKSIKKKQDLAKRKKAYKKFLKKQYAKMFRNENAPVTQTSETTQVLKTKTKQTYNVLKRTGKAGNKIAKIMVNVTKKVVELMKKVTMKAILLVIKFMLPVLCVIFLITTIITIVAGIFSLFAENMGAYQSEESEMLATESNFVAFENELKDTINNIPNDYPGYDYYDLPDLSLITHDPHELTALLTAMFGVYTAETVQVDIHAIFDLMYELKFEEVAGEYHPPLTDSEGNQMYDEQNNPLYSDVPVPTVTLKVTLETMTLYEVAQMILDDAQFEHFEILLETQGGYSDLFDQVQIPEVSIYSLSTMSVETNSSPSIITTHHMITNQQFAKTVKFGEQFIGMEYVFGGSSPETGFDCSGFISYILNETGVASFSRTTAQGLYNMSTPIENGQQQAGDLVFFQGTYNTPNTVTHVGYYVGNGIMLHCGNPIGYVDINSSAYAKSFYGFGRIS